MNYLAAFQLAVMAALLVAGVVLASWTAGMVIRWIIKKPRG